MNDSTGQRPERRRYSRVHPKGTLLVHSPGHAQRGRLINLSGGGAYVLTRVTLPIRLLSRNVDFEIRLDSGRAAWLRGQGTIARIDPSGFAIVFGDASPAMVGMIDELTTASHASKRVVSVVLVDTDTGRRTALAAGFRATGCAVIEVSTPLEAIVRLGESSFEPDVIALAGAQIANADMRAFVEREHPRARLVSIGDELLEPDGIPNWLSAADPRNDLPHRVREVLVRPRR